MATLSLLCLSRSGCAVQARQTLCSALHQRKFYSKTGKKPSWVSLCISQRIQSSTLAFCCFSTKGNDGKNLHASFEEQLREMQEERENVLGWNDDGGTAASNDMDEMHRYNDFQSQFQDLQEEHIEEGHGVRDTEKDGKRLSNLGRPGDDNNMEAYLHELKLEREEIFGFSHKDHSAWGNLANGTEKLSASFMEEIKQARADVAAEEQLELQGINNNHHEGYDEGSRRLTHLSKDGKSLNMVDVGQKAATQRMARAETKVLFPPEVVEAFTLNNDNDLIGPKGPIFATAKVAGIMAAKKTSELIPLCHPLPLDKVEVDIRLQSRNVVLISCECRVTHKTGVEMEALTGASIAALTIYDMVKAISHKTTIEETVLVSKTGGKRTLGPTQEDPFGL